MREISNGAKGTAELTVTEKDLAVNVGSGSLEVFATPTMIMLMEKSACRCIESALESDETTVGTEINVKHLSADPLGMNIRAEAELTAVNGRELCFDVKAFDEKGLIGEGTHKRFVVYGEKFTAKTKAKLKDGQ